MSSPTHRTPAAPAPPPRQPGEPPAQLAALCWRKGRGGREVLLVSSSSGRWILPKGWPMRGRSDAQAVLTEAWEEGGIRRGKVGRREIGSYLAAKRTADGDELVFRHRVFAIKVTETTDDFPEAERRDRVWLPPAEAAGLVEEEGLRDILRRF
jgi:8-oxo-dGTP pyrophosphatase MutT (NUDIX family)